MKRKKVALYNPYLDSLGGGEKHILSILEVLEKEAGYEPYIFWDTNLSEPLKDKLDVHFTNLSFLPNIFQNKSGLIQKLHTLKDFDLFFYVTNGSYFFSSAKKNYVFCMVPNKNLFAATAINWLKTKNFSFITNSHFTQKWLSKWNIESEVIYPYISDDYIQLQNIDLKKEKIILVTGRFFNHLHSKRQDIAIEAFNKLQEQGHFTDYKLILAGSVQSSDTDYLNKVTNMAVLNPNIEIKVNVSFTELFDLYKKANYYWHFTGYNVDEEIEPEKVEHLGITPLEAMAAGCTVFCYNAGGPKEIIKDGENGFLFSSIDNLIEKMTHLSLQHKDQLTKNAQQFINITFSYIHFKKKVLQQFTNL